MECINCEQKKCYTDGKDCVGIDNSDDFENNDNLRIATEIESEFYMKYTRLEELIVYMKRKSIKKIGIAFCIGLSNEAKILGKILKDKGFKVFSVVCKLGGISKDSIGFPKIKNERYESACNPKLQAKKLNDKKTELNIILGLCIGHDIEFTNASNAPVTTFAVKDRVLSHNPLGALYSQYYIKKISNNEYK